MFLQDLPNVFIEHRKDLQNGGTDKDFATQHNNFQTSALKNVQKKDSDAITLLVYRHSFRNTILLGTALCAYAQ